MKLKELFPGVYFFKGKILTKNLVPGQKVYGERLFKISGKEYREWNPRRSKLAAALKNGLKYFPFKKESQVLYLGSAEGTTVSHLSDVLEGNGLIAGVDISARVMRKFIMLCEQRKNLLPVMASANKPETYQDFLPEKVDVLYQDVSQKNQPEIFLKNAQAFLKKGGFGLMAGAGLGKAYSKYRITPRVTTGPVLPVWFGYGGDVNHSGYYINLGTFVNIKAKYSLHFSLGRYLFEKLRFNNARFYLEYKSYH